MTSPIYGPTYHVEEQRTYVVRRNDGEVILTTANLLVANYAATFLNRIGSFATIDTSGGNNSVPVQHSVSSGLNDY